MCTPTYLIRHVKRNSCTFLSFIHTHTMVLILEDSTVARSWEIKFCIISKTFLFSMYFDFFCKLLDIHPRFNDQSYAIIYLFILE